MNRNATNLLSKNIRKNFPYFRLQMQNRAYCWVSIDMPSPQGYMREEDEPDIPFMKRINGFRDLREHAKAYCKEHYDAIFVDKNRRILPPEHEQVRIEWAFKKDPEIHKRFLVTSDSAHKMGHSTASLDRTKRGTMLFHGNLDTTVLKDGVVDRSGFAAMGIRKKKLAFNRKTYFQDWSRFSHVLMKIRGDGRTYAITLGCPGDFDIEYGDVFMYPLHTHGGPYWQFAMIPFSKFVLTVNGRIPDRAQRPVVRWKKNMRPMNIISTFGVTLMDRITGPFQLEIEWIGVYKDITTFEEWAYEEYKIPLPMP